MTSEQISTWLQSDLVGSLSPIDVTLLVLLLIAAVTDIRSHRIDNWLTYPGMLLGLALNFLASGVDGFWFSIGGWFTCGLLMLLCFVLFDIGGGDVKLLAMVGAFRGVHDGTELLLWTCVLGAACGIVWIIWDQGAINLLRRAGRHLRLVVQSGSWVPLDEEERQPLKRGLFLAPACLAGALVMMLR